MDIRYLGPDGVALIRFDPADLPQCWPIYSQPLEPDQPPWPGLVSHLIYWDEKGRWVEYRYEFDAHREDYGLDSDVRTCKIVARDYAIGLLRSIGLPAPDLPPLECSQAELAAAMGKDRHYTGYMSTIRDIADVEQIGPRKWRVRFHDPVLHRTILDKIERGRM